MATDKQTKFQITKYINKHTHAQRHRATATDHCKNAVNFPNFASLLLGHIAADACNFV